MVSWCSVHLGNFHVFAEVARLLIAFEFGVNSGAGSQCPDVHLVAVGATGLLAIAGCIDFPARSRATCPL